MQITYLDPRREYAKRQDDRLNEAMYYFHVAPAEFRKILFVFRHERAGQSLAAYYLRTHGHLVPNGVEVWELDTHADVATQLR
jgi:hypothetical protein